MNAAKRANKLKNYYMNDAFVSNLNLSKFSYDRTNLNLSKFSYDRTKNFSLIKNICTDLQFSWKEFLHFCCGLEGLNGDQNFFSEEENIFNEKGFECFRLKQKKSDFQC